MAMDRYKTLEKRNAEENQELNQTAKDLTRRLFDFNGNPLAQNFVRRDVKILGKPNVIIEYDKEHLRVIEKRLDAFVIKDYDFNMNPPNMKLTNEESIDQHHRYYKEAETLYKINKREN